MLAGVDEEVINKFKVQSFMFQLVRINCFNEGRNLHKIWPGTDEGDDFHKLTTSFIAKSIFFVTKQISLKPFYKLQLSSLPLLMNPDRAQECAVGP